MLLRSLMGNFVFCAAKDFYDALIFREEIMFELYVNACFCKLKRMKIHGYDVLRNNYRRINVQILVAIIEGEIEFF